MAPPCMFPTRNSSWQLFDPNIFILNPHHQVTAQRESKGVVQAAIPQAIVIPRGDHELPWSCTSARDSFIQPAYTYQDRLCWALSWLYWGYRYGAGPPGKEKIGRKDGQAWSTGSLQRPFWGLWRQFCLGGWALLFHLCVGSPLWPFPL